MVRNYSPEPVDPAMVDRVLAAGHRAPSAGNSTGWAFLVLDSPADVARYWRATAGERVDAPDRWLRGMMTAPVLVVPLSSKDAYLDRYAEPDKGWTDRDEDRWSAPYWFVDAGMAGMAMLLRAVDLGLGACFFGVPADRVEAVRAAFGVPLDQLVVGVVSLGHPVVGGSRGSPGRRPRRPAEELVHRGSW